MRTRARLWSLVAFLLAIYPLFAVARPFEADGDVVRPSSTASTTFRTTFARVRPERRGGNSSTSSSPPAKGGGGGSSSTSNAKASSNTDTDASTTTTGNVKSATTSSRVTTLSAAGQAPMTSTVITYVQPASGSSSPLSTPIIIVIAACGGLAVILIVIGCCIAQRRRSDKNDWLTRLLSGDDDEASSPRSSRSRTKDEESSLSPPKPTAQPTVPQMSMMGMSPFYQMFGGMPPGQAQMQPQSYMTPTPAPSFRQASMARRAGSMSNASRSNARYAPRSPGVPHYPGLPSIEPNVYDNGSPSVAVSQNEKNRWLRKARQGLTASQAPDLLPPDRPPSPEHTLWEGGNETGSDNLTSISRRHLKKMRKAASKRQRDMPAPASGVSNRQDKISLSDSDLAMSRAASTRQTGTQRPPATAFSLSNSDLMPANPSSYRGASNDGIPQNSFFGGSMLSKPRHRRIDSLIRSDVISKRSR